MRREAPAVAEQLGRRGALERQTPKQPRGGASSIQNEEREKKGGRWTLFDSRTTLYVCAAYVGGDAQVKVTHILPLNTPKQFPPRKG